ncbi:MAG: hypothetical protein FWF56_04875 [Firmicutes bacterium]|nr:hypothetical protein [Bacillota bacterium]MCL1953878.1 hypothetical protein [Bacillota bacterium]
MIQLILVSIIVVISLFYNTVFVHIKTRKRLKYVTEDTRFYEYKNIYIIGFVVNASLLILSASIVLCYGVEWEWFGGTAMLSVFPTFIIGAIIQLLVMKHMFKYKPKFKFWECKYGIPPNYNYLKNLKLTKKIGFCAFFTIYIYIYTIVSSFLPILLMYCGIDVNGIMLR